METQKHCCDKFFHLGTAFEIVGKTLVITVKNAEDICNREPFYFRICSCPPPSATPLQVLLKVNGTNIPFEDKLGNYIFSNQLKPRKVYCCAYGSTPAHVLAFNEFGC